MSDDVGDYYRSKQEPVDPAMQSEDWRAFDDILQNFHDYEKVDPRFEAIVGRLLIDFPSADLAKVLALFLQNVWNDDYIVAWRCWDDLRAVMTNDRGA